MNNPFCVHGSKSPKCRHGEIVVGEWVTDAEGESRNRPIRCLGCPAHGEQSENLQRRDREKE